MNKIVKQVISIYRDKKEEFDKRLVDFKKAGKSDRAVLHELIFCIFTPQSKAVSCWECVEAIIEKKLMLSSSPSQLLKLRQINMVRFKNKKARFAVMARDRFVKKGKITIRKYLSGFESVFDARKHLAREIKGYGYKEASHFLRNIGFYEDVAILDRHILKNLKLMGVIKKVPSAVTPSEYLNIEDKMRGFSEKINIPMGALDLVLWYKETGKIFK